MAWKRLDIIVERVVGRIVDTGEDRTAIRSIRPEKARAEAPASSREETLPAKEDDANRSMATARPTRLPTSAVVIDLLVYREEVGRRAVGGGGPRPASVRRNAPGSELRGTVLRFVV